MSEQRPLVDELIEVVERLVREVDKHDSDGDCWTCERAIHAPSCPWYAAEQVLARARRERHEAEAARKALEESRRERGAWHDTLGDARAAGTLDGYAHRAPSEDTAAMDRAACEMTRCDACGHLGMDYQPFYREHPRSYRAFQVCPECGASWEF